MNHEVQQRLQQGLYEVGRLVGKQKTDKRLPVGFYSTGV